MSLVPSLFPSPVGMGYIAYDKSMKSKNNNSDIFSEDDADELIKKDAIFWLICIETYKETRNPLLGKKMNWRLGWNDAETCIYHHTDDERKIIIGFRGTAASKDIYDDYELSMNRMFPRAIEAIQITRNLLNQNYFIKVCGHSLGGAIAREVGKEFGIRVVTFNAAAPPTAPVISSKNEIDYHIVYDIISAWQSPNTIRIDKGFYPYPSFLQKMDKTAELYGYIDQMIESHSLKNFSKTIDGVIMSAEDESKKMNQWLHSLPWHVKKHLFIILFQFHGNFSFPDIVKN